MKNNKYKWISGQWRTKSKIMWFPGLISIFVVFWVCFQLGLITKFHPSHHILFLSTQMCYFFPDCKMNLVMSIVRADGLSLCICWNWRYFFHFREKGEKINYFFSCTRLEWTIERVLISLQFDWCQMCGL